MSYTPEDANRFITNSLEALGASSEVQGTHSRGDVRQDLLAAAQVNATLAVAAATLALHAECEKANALSTHGYSDGS